MLLLRTPPLKDTWECPSLDWLPGPEPVAQQESPLLLLQGAVWRGWPTPAPTMGGLDRPQPLTAPPWEAFKTPRAGARSQVPLWSPDANSRGRCFLLPQRGSRTIYSSPAGSWAVGRGLHRPRGGKGQAGDDLRSPRCCGGGRPFFLALFPHRRVGVAIVPPVQKLCEDTANPENSPAD